MTTPSALRRPDSVPLRRRLAARFAVMLAQPLAVLPPRRIRAVLAVLRRGARPARYEEAAAAQEAIHAVSLACLGPQGCLRRSLAVTLLCRLSGRWPTWCVGVRIMPPFAAHAWVEADGRPVEEEMPADYLRSLITVPAAGPPPRS